jgi:L-rhamnose isomerase
MNWLITLPQEKSVEIKADAGYALSYYQDNVQVSKHCWEGDETETPLENCRESGLN